MHLETLRDFYLRELKDLHSVEKQLTSNWPGLQFIGQPPIELSTGGCGGADDPLVIETSFLLFPP